MKRPKLPPIKICTKNRLTDSQLKYALRFIPNLRTRKNKFVSGSQYHTVYCIVNLVNSSCYFGKHTFNYNPKLFGESDYTGTNQHLWNAIYKYGIENFRMLILKYFKTSKQAYAYETKIITQQMVKSKHCYNYQGGGKGFATGKFHHIHTKVKLGEHPFQLRSDGSCAGGDAQKQLLQEGKHNFQVRIDGSSISKDKVIAGTHNLLTRSDGSNTASDLVKAGVHHCLGTKPWESPKTTVESKLTWRLAGKIYKQYRKDITQGYIKLYNIFSSQVCLSKQALHTMVDKFRKDWIPTQDEDWLQFRKKCSA